MTFTTALCIKPFSSNHSHRRRRNRQQHDPSSPKVGCLGQIHQCKTAENTAAPPPLIPPLQHGSRRFYLLMASVGFLANPLKHQCKKKKAALRGRRVVSVEDIESPLPVAVKQIEESVRVVEFKEMDPPLPVREIENRALSLWKRRCRSRKLEELFFCRKEKVMTPNEVLVV